MANVLFKRGLQSKLPANGYAQDGVFYLTTDTNRLYIGQGTDRVLLNQTVNFASNVQELNRMAEEWRNAGTEALHARDMYYILPTATDAENTQGGNILAVWCQGADNKYNWFQVNPDHDTTVNEFFAELASGSNKVTMTMGISQSDPSIDTKTVEFAIEGSGKTIEVKADANGTGFLLKGDTYTLSGKDGEIKLASALGQAESSVKFIAGDNVTIANGDNNNEIKLSAKDTVNSSMVLDLDDTGKLFVKVIDNKGGEVSAETDSIVMKYGQGGLKSAPIGGTLDVYSKDDVDNLLKDLNGLTYRGTIGENGTYTMGPDFKVYVDVNTAANVHNGDMFLVAGNVKYGTDAYAKTGDLLIATGTENASGVLESITWTFVPSGDDAKLDTTYEFVADTANHGLSVIAKSSLDGDLGEVGSIKVAAGEAMTVSSALEDSDESKLKVTVNHAKVSHSVADPEDNRINLNSIDDVDVVTGVTVNDHGHVTAINTAKVVAPRYKLNDLPEITISGSAAAGTVHTAVIKQGIARNGETAEFQDTGYQLKSETLVITAGDTEDVININYAWGTF